MSGIQVIALVILAVSIITDYGTDKGKHTKAKIFHAICMLLLVYSCADAPAILGRILAHFGNFQQKLDVPVGFISGHAHMFLYIAHTLICTIVLILAARMFNRRDSARKQLIYVLPLLVLSEGINFYMGWVGAGDDQELSDMLIFWIGFAVMGSIGGVIMWIYSTRFMKEFFMPQQPIDDTIVEAEPATESNKPSTDN